MRIVFALAGLHRVDRGAEVAFISVATELARAGEDVTLIGSGPERPGVPYRYLSAPAAARERFERFPSMPALRNDTAWEEATFVPGLLRVYRPADYDITLTCSYPFTNWALRRPRLGRKRPPHVFVTQNGDWPAISDESEFRLFGCDGLVCTNPDFFARARYPAALIGNGADLNRFRPGAPDRGRFGLHPSRPIVLMVSALIPSKHVDEGIEAVARLPDAELVVAGDGPIRDQILGLAQHRLPGRFRQVRVAAADMPALYRSADVFLHLSRSESFGNVYVEAMACGLPVVAIDNPRTRWIVGDEAFLARADDPAGVAEQLTAALAAGPGLQAEQAVRAKQFGWREIGLKYRKFLDSVVERRG